MSCADMGVSVTSHAEVGVSVTSHAEVGVSMMSHVDVDVSMTSDAEGCGPGHRLAVRACVGHTYVQRLRSHAGPPPGHPKPNIRTLNLAIPNPEPQVRPPGQGNHQQAARQRGPQGRHAAGVPGRDRAAQGAAGGAGFRVLCSASEAGRVQGCTISAVGDQGSRSRVRR
jgi:hypothetical protein